MKKSLIAACLVSVFAVSSFAQPTPATPPAQAGVKLVAERDAAWAKAHPGGAPTADPMAHHKTMHAKAMKSGRHAKHVKHAKHTKHGKPSKHAKHKAKQAA